MVAFKKGKVVEEGAFYYKKPRLIKLCLLYTSDAADERSSVDLGGRRIIKKKNIYNVSGVQYTQYKIRELVTDK